jgi:hypothetical protein
MTAVMTTATATYAPNFIRSATAPETIVAAVAANIAWKAKSISSGIPTSPATSS